MNGDYPSAILVLTSFQTSVAGRPVRAENRTVPPARIVSGQVCLECRDRLAAHRVRITVVRGGLKAGEEQVQGRSSCERIRLVVASCRAGGTVPANIVVERAIYSDAGGTDWAAGHVLATRIR